MAVMKTYLIKNNSGSEVTIDSLGISIPDSGTFQGDDISFFKIIGNDDLRDLVQAGTLVLNDGSGDLSAADAVKYLFSQSKYELESDYYSKTQLQTSGQSSVNWDNITNAPSFGSPTWIDPVLYIVLDIGLASPPGSPSTGDVYVDDSDHYFKYNGATWDDLGAASSGDRVINLVDATQDIYEYSGSSWDDLGTETDNTAVMVNDDGDGKEAQYIYDDTSNTWKKIGDVDFAGHFDGGAGKHDASEIDVEGTYSNITGTPTDLENTVGAIDTKLGSLQSDVDNKTLDEAYDGGGSGAGRVVNTDAGPIELDRGSSTDPSLRLVPKAALPSTNLADGDIDIKDGILCIYDATRTKWLSIQRNNLVFGDNGKVKNRYLSIGTGLVVSSASAPRMLKDVCLTGISVQVSASDTFDIIVRKNGVASDIYTLSVTAADGDKNNALNVDLNADDYIQIYLSSSNKIEDPVVLLEFADRV